MNVSILANLTSAVVAQTSQPGGGAGFLEMFRGWQGFLLIAIPLLWIFVFSTRRKDDRKKKDALAAIKRGDQVQTIGGIIGKVVDTQDTKILLKVDETSNTKIWFTRTAIYKVLDDEKAAAAAK